MSTVMVHLGDHRDYPIVVKPGAIKEVGHLVKGRVRGKQAFVLTHARIRRLYGRPVEQSLRSNGFQVKVIVLPEGETTKSLKMVEEVIAKLIKSQADRSAFLVALGGGVIGDLAGFVASIYMRGIDFVQVPTTLLAQIDSSVGGKVAVNHQLGKNLIGAFLQPRLVVTDPLVLRSLAKRQLKAGLAEMIKAAIIADHQFFRLLKKKMNELLALDINSLSWAIVRSCKIKALVVEKDEQEHGLRAILNYGHTVGHALETYHQYQKYLHGEAVAIGMVVAAKIAEANHVLTSSQADEQIAVIKQAGLPIKGNRENINKLITIMKTDKKASNGEIKFVLTPKIGHARISKKIAPFSVHRVLKAVLGSA